MCRSHLFCDSGYRLKTPVYVRFSHTQAFFIVAISTFRDSDSVNLLVRKGRLYG